MMSSRGKGDLTGHYERLATRFDVNWVYSEAFVSWMTSRICERLQPREGDRVLDAGCGTGLYARGLALAARSVVCADSSGDRKSVV